MLNLAKRTAGVRIGGASVVAERVPVEHPALPVETVSIADLTPHASNYRQHPADQLAHLVQSIRDHGFYRNVVISRDGTILAGHGVVEAACSMGLTEVPAIRLDLEANDPRALAVLIRDNEIAKLAEPDDAALAMLLATIQADGEPIDTLGIGADELGRLLALVDGMAPPGVEFKEYDESAAEEVAWLECPACAHRWPK